MHPEDLEVHQSQAAKFLKDMVDRAAELGLPEEELPRFILDASFYQGYMFGMRRARKAMH